MTAAERSELAEFRQEMNGRFDRVDDSQRDLDVRLRLVEGFVSNQQGRASVRADVSTSRLQWVGIALAVAVFAVALPAAALAIIHIAALLAG